MPEHADQNRQRWGATVRNEADGPVIHRQASFNTDEDLINEVYRQEHAG
ncbi:MAG: hypothetical protein AB7U20_11190 [Planctomycetaceae bacterium]